jgi:hypothetical protein
MHARRTLLVATIALGLAACGADRPTGPTAPAGLDCPQLGVRLASVPAAFAVVHNQADELVLEPAGEGTEGRLTVRSEAPEVGGVNVVAAVQAHQERIESLPDGSYLGQQELVTPGGTAFWSRGSYTDGAGPTEETAVFAVHPDGQHLLSLLYTYPRGTDSAARVERLLEVLGEIEPLSR